MCTHRHDQSIDQLHEDLAARDRTIAELKKRADELARAAAEARTLRDEIDMMNEKLAEAQGYAIIYRTFSNITQHKLSHIHTHMHTLLKQCRGSTHTS